MLSCDIVVSYVVFHVGSTALVGGNSTTPCYIVFVFFAF